MQFEAVWEKALAELEKVGLGKTKLEKYLGYLEKVGAQLSEKVELFRLVDPDGLTLLHWAADRGQVLKDVQCSMNIVHAQVKLWNFRWRWQCFC